MNHLVDRIGWLRAAVLGANDGIVSTASLIVGVAAASATQHDVIFVRGKIRITPSMFFLKASVGNRSAPGTKRVQKATRSPCLSMSVALLSCSGSSLSAYTKR